MSGSVHESYGLVTVSGEVKDPRKDGVEIFVGGLARASTPVP